MWSKFLNLYLNNDLSPAVWWWFLRRKTWKMGNSHYSGEDIWNYCNARHSFIWLRFTVETTSILCFSSVISAPLVKMIISACVHCKMWLCDGGKRGTMSGEILPLSTEEDVIVGYLSLLLCWNPQNPWSRMSGQQKEWESSLRFESVLKMQLHIFCFTKLNSSDFMILT